jgi:hypothetical protein
MRMVWFRSLQPLPAAAAPHRVRPCLELLEDRLLLAWKSVPPPQIRMPHFPTQVVFDLHSDAQGTDTITGRKVDYFQFTAPVGGYYRFSAQGVLGVPDTVLAVFNRRGKRLGYNDDANPGTSDSALLMNLVAGRKFFFGISKFRGTPGGEYAWRVEGPSPGPADDTFEENDSPAEVVELGPLTGLRTEAGLVMADNADWFRFRMVGPGAATNFVRINFQHVQGDLDLIVYNLGLAEVGRSTGITDAEQVSLHGLDRGIYYVKIYGYQGAHNPSYTLQINPSRGAPGSDDPYEDNDAFPQAFNLGTLGEPQTYADLVLADSADWFSFTMNGPGTAGDRVRLDFQQADGDLDLELYDATGKFLARSDSGGDGEEIALEGRAAGTYFVAVTGNLGATNASYALLIDPGVPTPAQQFNIQLSFNNLPASQRAIFNQAAARWAEIITADLPDAVYLGQLVDDVFIEAYAIGIDGPNGILGQAGPDAFRTGSFLPYHGIMVFDTADLAAMEADGSLRDVIIHEMAHVLGLGTIWEDLGLLSGKGTSNPRFLGPQATAEYNALFGLSAASVPVEGQAGLGSRDSHWRESVFTHELMTPFLSGATRPISRVTVASMADLGYTVNLDAADPFTPPSAVVSAPEGGSSGDGSAGLKVEARTRSASKGRINPRLRFGR